MRRDGEKSLAPHVFPPFPRLSGPHVSHNTRSVPFRLVDSSRFNIVYSNNNNNNKNVHINTYINVEKTIEAHRRFFFLLFYVSHPLLATSSNRFLFRIVIIVIIRYAYYIYIYKYISTRNLFGYRRDKTRVFTSRKTKIDWQGMGREKRICVYTPYAA